MSHREQRDYVSYLKARFPDAFRSKKVLEVGSLDINGTVRDFFEGCEYVGVDVGEGPGVDVVAKGEDLDYPDRSFDVSISCECFEHNPAWRETFVNMHRMSSKMVIFTCASEGRPEHGTQRSDPGSSPLTTGWDYYRNLVEEDFGSLPLDRMFSRYEFERNYTSHDLYFWGEVR